ncbi:aminotransferase class III [Thermotoga sp. Ku-13t]|uniref:aspartate aminotransferase family protein n=1 Tax=Thermotoga sp. Ku-13t TaxID=1755813 RepID=UPI0013EC5426|nr:aminotransferase class III-fold pyridoxal phosphate-dependent enzyme [Thermotoga sp. Ku-13t]KAF2958116.1 aminotransferase class III [Thermotoga sp. Ku-13t]
MSHICPVYKPFPIQIDRARGIYIYSTDGKRYIDTFSGIGVLAFGHSDEDIKKAMIEKMERYMHISNFFLDEDAEIVAEKLIQKTGRDGKVFFTNSGAEANEAALKAVKKFRKGLIVSFERNFHGRTIAALSVTGFDGLRKPFEPLLSDVVFLPHNDVDSFKKLLNERGKEIAAVFLECVHGSGGLNVLDGELAKLIKEARREFGFLLVADEVQAGLGRTGKFFSYQHFDLQPDIVTVAKALGGGLPLGAVLFLEDVADVFGYSEHGSTFAPNPVALAGARIVLNKLTDEFIHRVAEKGRFMKERLLRMGSGILTVKGLGLMIGVEVNVNPEVLKQVALKNGLLLNVVSGNVVRFLPALNISFDQIEEMLELFERSLNEVYGRDHVEKVDSSKS